MVRKAAAKPSSLVMSLGVTVKNKLLSEAAAQSDLYAAGVYNFGKDHAEPEKQISIRTVIARPSIVDNEQYATINVLDTLVSKMTIVI